MEELKGPETGLDLLANYKEQILKRYPKDDSTWEELRTLVLDIMKIKAFTPEFAQFLQTSFPKIEKLCLNHTNLKTLQGFPDLPYLRRLELQDNGLKDADAHLEVLAEKCPSLRVLLLGGNRFKDSQILINALKPLKHLEAVDIELNQLPEGIEKELFGALPSLRSVSEKDKSGATVDDEDEEDDDEEADEGENLKDFYEADYSDDDDAADEDYDATQAEARSTLDDDVVSDDEDNEEDDGDDQGRNKTNKRSTNTEAQEDNNTKRPRQSE